MSAKAALVAGNNVDVELPNVVVVSVSDDGSYALVRLPGDDSPDKRVELWLPANDPRVVISLIAPNNWPPRENDTWIVPGITPPAFVVANEQGVLYFLTAQAIRQSYNSKATVLPPTVDDALAAYGNKLTMLYRQPTA